MAGTERMEQKMIGSNIMQEAQEHFAHCVQVMGGIPATSRRLGIDERAIRRFINGERPLSKRLLEDTAKALRVLIAEAASADGDIAAILSRWPNEASFPAVQAGTAPS